MISMKKIESALVVALSGLAVSVFFSQTGTDAFGLTSLALLLIWRFSPGYKPAGKLPKSLIIITAIFLLNIAVSTFISVNKAEGIGQLWKIRNMLLGGLLFTCPLGDKKREQVMTAFLLGAFFSGLIGIFQHFGILFNMADRAHGFTHPIYYSAILTFPCAAAILLLLSRSSFERSGWRRYLLIASIIATFGGILFSQSRGEWVALFASSVIVLFLYDRRKAAIPIFSATAALILVFSLNGTLRTRATSIVTSIGSEDYRGSTGNRLELWKAALLMYEKSPILGVGIGDWRTSIDRLIAEGKVKPVLTKPHAHNMFFQTLSTEGTAGFIILIAFLFVLFRWGASLIKDHGGIAGYVIIFCTLLVIIGGLTEICIGESKYFAEYCLMIGLFGGYLPETLRSVSPARRED